MRIRIENSIVTVKKKKVYIDGRVTEKLLPIFIQGKVAGIMNPVTGNVMFDQNTGYKTQLINSIKMIKGTSRDTKHHESKKFLPIQRRTEKGEIEINLS